MINGNKMNLGQYNKISVVLIDYTQYVVLIYFVKVDLLKY